MKQSTIKRLFALSGNRCAFPDCPTRLAAEGGTEFVAEICHIEAENSTGARFNREQLDEERHGFSNLILMCGTHHTKIDGDEKTYTVAKLKEWKHRAETAALDGSITGSSKDLPAVIASAIVAELASRIPVQARLDADAIATVALAEAAADIATFRQGARWPLHPVKLALRVVGQEANTPSFSTSRLADVISKFNEVTIVANPGTGKTTTLIQTTEAAIHERKCVAIYVPLNELTVGSGPLLVTITQRPAFQSTTSGHLETLAAIGKLVLVLDGWNELSDSSRHFVKAQLAQLRRNFPDLGIVVSTRRQAVHPPLDGPIVEIQPLSQDQQLEIAQAINGTAGARIIDHALRTPGLRELVEIPLYLTALVSRATDGELPTTKEEVLRLFAALHETDQEAAEALRAIFHEQLMQRLAIWTTQLGTTSLSEADARAVVLGTHKNLVAQQQLHAPVDPGKALSLLVANHLLIRIGTDPQKYEFQHQQFQEFYASFYVEQEMLEAASGESAATDKLRKSILDRRHWEEAVLFACERLSRTDNHGAVTNAIMLALGVDPMLSAEMIYRSSDAVWEAISARIKSFVERWHQPGRIDRAVKFMLTAGKPEFADLIWPLLLDTDDQVSLGALHLVQRIRPGALGSDVQRRLAGVDEKVRTTLLSDFAYRGDIQTLQLVTRLAKEDPSEAMRESVAEGLAFRQAEALLADLLEVSGPTVWRKLAHHGFDRDIADPKIRQRLQAERKQMESETRDNFSRLQALVRNDGHPDEVQAALEGLDYSPRDDGLAHLLYDIRQKYPSAIAEACRTWLKSGKELPLHIDEHLSGASLRPDPAILAIATADGAERRSLAAAALCDATAVGTLLGIAVEKHAALAGGSYATHRPFYEELHEYEARLASTQAEVFARALMDRPPTSDPREIAFLADLITKHGRFGARQGTITLPKDLKDGLSTLLNSWANALAGDPKSTRAQMAEVAMAIHRIPSPEASDSVKLMLDEDIRRKRSGEEPGMIWSNWYAKAFVAIGDDKVVDLLKAYLDDEDFGAEAARSLKAIYDVCEGRQLADGPMRGWPNYIGVADARLRKERRADEESACAAPILAAIERICQNSQTDAERRRALEMSLVVLSVPYVDKEGTINKTAGLPLPISAKQNLFCGMAMDGQVLPIERIREGIDDWIESTKTQSWKLHDNNNWEIERWLELLAFTDDPESVVDAVREITALFPYPHQMEGVVAALGNAPGREAEKALVRLARECHWIANEYAFVNAFMRRNDESSMFSMLDLIKDGTLGRKKGGVDRRDIVHKLAHRLQTSPAILATAKARYLRDNSETLLEVALAEIGQPDIVVLLVRAYAQTDKPFDGLLALAIREAATTRQPSSTWSGAFELSPQPLADLRKELYSLLGGPAEELGRKGLDAIDRLRDEYGVPDNEPRHPDINAGGDWPAPTHHGSGRH